MEEPFEEESSDGYLPSSKDSESGYENNIDNIPDFHVIVVNQSEVANQNMIIELHHCRQSSSKKYLDSTLYTSIMYRFYTEKCMDENRKSVSA